MTQISKSAFNTTWADSAGTFADNTTRAISEADMRQFSQDIKDSCLFVLDTNLSQIVSTKVTVSSAELLASFTTPKTLVAAQGAGTVVELISATGFLDYNSTTYVNGGGGGITIDYVNTLSTLTGVYPIDQTSDYMYVFTKAVHQRAASNMTNQPLILYSPTSNPTTGNSPLYVYLTYRVITL